jgi:hypothetical protein
VTYDIMGELSLIPCRSLLRRTIAHACVARDYRCDYGVIDRIHDIIFVLCFGTWLEEANGRN